jgi:peroxiredoxin
MALTYSESPKLGSIAPDFNLKGTDGKTYSLKSFADAKVLVVVFYCNHCPYVIAVDDRVSALARQYLPQGVSLVAINSNDAVRYPDDSFEQMKVRAHEKKYVFPYLYDETQEVARAYGAVCTPDIFAYVNRGSGRFELGYAGRLDDSWKDETQVKRRELAEALDQILLGNAPATPQHPSMGCSIKWKLTDKFR